MKKIEPERNRPAANLPYQQINRAFRLQYLVPGTGIEIRQDRNGVCYISATGGSAANLVPGDNIEITEREDGATVISAVDLVTKISGGQNVKVIVNPETGEAVISTVIDPGVNSHYKGVFDKTENLIEAVPDPEEGDFALVKEITITNGEVSWEGLNKHCFWIDGEWNVVDQMLTFTNDERLLKKFYSVGGSSPTIYLHEIARTGDFQKLTNIPIVATPEATIEGYTLSVTCSTKGAEIWYTTDGSMPHVNGTKYTGPITVSSSTTYRFVAIKNGMINSLEAVVNADYSLRAPVISLDWTDGEVSMINKNDSGEIYYTTDGTTPTAQSALYKAPFVITSATSFKAVVIDRSHGGAVSAVTEISFEKTRIALSASENGLTGEIQYSIQDSYTDAEYATYTIDGSDPDYGSEQLVSAVAGQRYGNYFVFKARGFREGCVPSDVVERCESYDSPTAPTVTFDAQENTVTMERDGNVLDLPEILLETDNEEPEINCRIYYTLDGSTPTDQSTLYTGPFQINGPVTVKAVLVAYGQYSSAVTTEEIIISSAPDIRMDSDTGLVSISAHSGDEIRYTTDGTTPTAESPLYKEPFSVENMETVTVNAVAFYNGHASKMASETYTGLSWGAEVSPVINYETGVVSVSSRQSEVGASVFYRSASEGQEPGNWLPYEGGTKLPLFSDSNPQIVSFRQTKEGYIPSSYSDGPFGYENPDAPAISFEEDSATIELSGNTADIPLRTTTDLPALGARIYYTTDGSTPTQESDLYTGPFQVSGRVTVKAITVVYGQHASDIATASASVVSAPEISLDSDSGKVSIAAQEGAVVHYTIDGSTPTAESPVYREPFSVENMKSVTVKAIALFDGQQSQTASETFSGLSWGTSVAPDINYETGVVNVYSRQSESDADVFYAVVSEGQEPETWIPYNGKTETPLFDDSNPKTVYFRQTKEGKIPSSYAEGPFGYEKPDAPEISFEETSAKIELSGNTADIPLHTTSDLPALGARIYYTTDGSTPTHESDLYTGPFQVSGRVTVKAITVVYGQHASDIATASATIIDAPEISLDSDSGYVSISATPGAEIHYTKDGSTPTAESPVYTGPFRLAQAVLNPKTYTIKAIAIVSGNESPVASERYPCLVWSGESSVVIDKDAGIIYRKSRTPEDGATVYYQFYPGGYPWELYEGAVEQPYFSSSNPLEINYKQTKEGCVPAAYGTTRVGENTPDAPLIVFNKNTSKAVIDLDGNTVGIPLHTTTENPELGARIYYTLDGTTPDDKNGTLYDGVSEILIADGQTMKAVTVCYGTHVSEVAILTPENTAVSFSPHFFDAKAYESLGEYVHDVSSVFPGKSYMSELDRTIYFTAAVPDNGPTGGIVFKDSYGNDIHDASLVLQTIDDLLIDNFGEISELEQPVKDAIVGWLEANKGKKLICMTDSFEVPINTDSVTVSVVNDGVEYSGKIILETIQSEESMTPLFCSRPVLHRLNEAFCIESQEIQPLFIETNGEGNPQWKEKLRYTRNNVFQHIAHEGVTMVSGTFYLFGESDTTMRVSYGMNNHNRFQFRNPVNIRGDLRYLTISPYLLYEFQVYEGLFAKLFSDCNIQSAEICVPASGTRVCRGMFMNSSIESAKVLSNPNEQAGDYCFLEMFENCRNIGEIFVCIDRVNGGTCDNWLRNAGAGNGRLHVIDSVDPSTVVIPAGWEVLNDNYQCGMCSQM